MAHLNGIPVRLEAVATRAAGRDAGAAGVDEDPPDLNRP